MGLLLCNARGVQSACEAARAAIATAQNAYARRATNLIKLGDFATCRNSTLNHELQGLK